MVYVHRFAYYDVGLNVYAVCFKSIDFFLNEGFGQPEFGYSVYEDAARKVKGFKYSHLIALFGEVASARETRRPRADDGDFMTVRCGDLQFPRKISIVVIGDKAFKPADADGLEFYAESAFAFALGFLGAYPSADGGE